MEPQKLSRKELFLQMHKQVVKPIPNPKSKTKKERPKNYKIKNGDKSVIVGSADEGKIGFAVHTNDVNTSYFKNMRTIIVGQPGSGKSYLCRNIIEKFYKSQIGNLVIIDPQAEYLSLREHFDFVIFGKNKDNCDIVINAKNADIYIKKIIEQKIPSIIDLSEYVDSSDKWKINIELIKSALSIRSKNFHPTIFVWEECHLFMQKGETNDLNAESRNYMKQMAVLGRKLGYSCIFISQRISQIHSDIQTSANNFIIGKTMQDADIKRNSELILADKTDFKTLKHEFWVYGENFDHYDLGLPIKGKSGKPTSQHRDMDTGLVELPAKSNRVKQWISLFDPKSFLNAV